MVSKKVIVKNSEGLHLRPASLLCKEAVRFECSIHFQFGNRNANAKSVLSVLSARVKCDDEVEFICEGEDEVEALNYIVKLVEEKFGVE